MGKISIVEENYARYKNIKKIINYSGEHCSKRSIMIIEEFFGFVGWFGFYFLAIEYNILEMHVFFRINS